MGFFDFDFDLDVDVDEDELVVDPDEPVAGAVAPPVGAEDAWASSEGVATRKGRVAPAG
ncbi:MAG TPA: hypothetical protein VK778_12585 [Solirubrobacteraceae bacterium]|nr:hypothetical protein [Solirubrobacteraceae bacterium]